MGCVGRYSVKGDEMRKVKAEFTVEAALVLPSVLLVFVEVMRQGIDLCVEVKETMANESAYNAVADFRQRQLWNRFIEQR